MSLRLCRLRQVERKWEEEEQLDIKEEEGEEDVEEDEEVEEEGEKVDKVEEMGELGVGVWHSWYFPISGHGWGWISGPGIVTLVIMEPCLMLIMIVKRSSMKYYRQTIAF